MKEKILIITSPCSSFVNHVDRAVVRLTQLLKQCQIEYTVTLGGLAFKQALGEYAHTDMVAFNTCEAEHLTLLDSLMTKSENNSAIWFVQDETELDLSFSEQYITHLSAAFPSIELVVFTNGLSSKMYRAWSLINVVRVIPKAILHALLTIDIQRITANATSSFTTALYDCLNTYSSGELPADNTTDCFDLDATVDYSLLLKQHRDQTSFSQIVRLPVSLNELVSEQLTNHILGYSQQYKILDFDLGFVDLDNPETRVKLNEIATVFTSLSYSFRLHCTLPADSPAEYFAYLQRAKVDSVHLLPVVGAPDRPANDEETILLNLRQISLVKRLHGLGIEVQWRLLLSRINLGSDLWVKFINELPVFFGFPAPIGVYWMQPKPPVSNAASDTADDAAILIADVLNGLRTCLGDWRTHPKDRYLSKGTGPAFARLFDRRGAIENWRFLNLNSAQTEFYQQLDDVTQAAQIKERMAHIPADKIDNFLSFLEHHRLIVSINNGQYFLNASQRRDFTQAWATAEL
ncbi:hypothetical protein [Spirosoma montaniterrae]|uniref:Uncharacterized protein n=1 Tax=Spirosoma montaniterrae TaxID=1178516 RepID=A0A1P9WW17_9BACT|nr:hypothetical protein [Spirosoma montaniterrae]AQG79577.1 hypothetical protein AWR27_09715 [Spirosoma montaniterrae]